jgi:hypothetical protein
VREGACIGAATILQPWTLRLILNAAALAAASPKVPLKLLARGLIHTRFECTRDEKSEYLSQIHSTFMDGH